MTEQLADRPHRPYLPSTGRIEVDPFVYLEEIGSITPFWADDPTDVTGYWVVTRYTDAREILQDHARFSAVDAPIPLVTIEDPLLPTYSDPPQVQKYRRAAVKAMSPTAVERLKPRMEEVCAGLIDRFADRGQCDVVTEFARIFPITVFLEFFGMPVDQREEFVHWAHRWLHNRFEQPLAWSKIREMVAAQVEAKRGQSVDDLLGLIANETVDGELLPIRSAVSLASTVFIGGLDTVPTAITWSLRHLALHPDLRAELIADLNKSESAVEEMLRLYPMALPKRRVTHDFQFHGVDMREGDRVLIAMPGVHRDPEVFENALQADLERENNRHMAFGLGAHRCVGMHLARPELVIAMRQWHERIPDYTLETDTDLNFQGGTLSLTRLPLKWSTQR